MYFCTRTPHYTDGTCITYGRKIVHLAGRLESLSATFAGQKKAGESMQIALVQKHVW